MYFTIMYVMLTNEPPTGEPSREPEPEAPAPATPRKARNYMDLDSDVDFEANTNTDVALKKADKGKGKVIDPPEAFYQGPALRVCSKSLTL